MIKNEVNTYSAGSIVDLMPEGMYDTLLTDVVVITNNPTGERLQEFHGGIEFNITINNRKLNWKVIHNFNDYFDLELTPLAINESNEVVKADIAPQIEKDIGNGDLLNVFHTLWNDYVDWKNNEINQDYLDSLLEEE
tara:strand:- start:1034 stop:1444 length:411 start_codon:yes stop_codon:yes gene_type:complete